MNFRSGKSFTTVVAAAILALVPLGAWAQKITGTVTDGGKSAVGGVTVYLVPANDVARLAKAPSIDIRRNVDDDEPMEDNLAANRDKYPHGVTNSSGAFAIDKVAAGSYFV